MNWADHINKQITKASKKLGLIWRLIESLPTVEAIYTSYIRPQLEYGCIIYANCTKEQGARLELCQRKAAIACTQAYNKMSNRRLLEELGWPTL